MIFTLKHILIFLMQMIIMFHDHHDQAAERSGEKPQDDFVHPDRPGDLRQELWETFSSAGIIALVMKDEDCQEHNSWSPPLSSTLISMDDKQIHQ